MNQMMATMDLINTQTLVWFLSLHGLFNAKAIFVEQQQWYYSTQS